MKYKNAYARSSDSTNSVIYTTPQDRTAILKSLVVCSDLEVDCTFSLVWKDKSNGDAEVRLVKSAVLPAGTLLGVLDSPMVLESGDSIHVSTDDGVVFATLSLMEVEN